MQKTCRHMLIYLLIGAFILGLTEPLPSARAAEATATDAGFPDIQSTSAIIMDAHTGQILYEKNSHSRAYPASITKILTSYLAIRDGDLSSTITMSNDAVWGIDRSSSHIALDVGEQISLSDALYAVMTVSANEAAWAVAEQVSGSLDAFVSLMNETAEELGCTDTHFTNANGLPDENHYTSAYDMALITKQALTNDTFCEYASTLYHEIPPTNKNSETRYLAQNNRMMQSGSEYYYSACQGGKTGYTDAAGGTLVVWAEKNDMKLICVTMGAADNSVNYQDSIALFDYAFSNYAVSTILSDYEFNAEQATEAQDFLNSYYNCENLGKMHLSIDTSQPFLLAKGADSSNLTMTFTPSADRLDEGYVGTLNVAYNGVTCLTLPVSYSGYVNSEDSEAVSEAYENGEIREALLKEKPNIAGYILAAVIVLAIIVLFIYANVIRPKRRKR